MDDKLVTTLSTTRWLSRWLQGKRDLIHVSKKITIQRKVDKKLENLTIDNKKQVEKMGIRVFSHILYNYTNMQNLREKCMQSWPLNRGLDSTYNFHTTQFTFIEIFISKYKQFDQIRWMRYVTIYVNVWQHEIHFFLYVQRIRECNNHLIFLHSTIEILKFPIFFFFQWNEKARLTQ